MSSSVSDANTVDFRDCLGHNLTRSSRVLLILTPSYVLLRKSGPLASKDASMKP